MRLLENKPPLPEEDVTNFALCYIEMLSVAFLKDGKEIKENQLFAKEKTKARLQNFRDLLKYQIENEIKIGENIEVEEYNEVLLIKDLKEVLKNIKSGETTEIEKHFAPIIIDNVRIVSNWKKGDCIKIFRKVVQDWLEEKYRKFETKANKILRYFQSISKK